ncbi:MAG TPA: NAD-dependent epimerase/dehydratase [Lentisphaeria bacterium]|nr:MAG: UDP-glucose 4-epimerase [Lentisphaerae bacterium GWF2_50_93]HCE45343.1 NAD-dependent epimerase/dehydratase [Lentisphaeria bacterium]
MNKILITGNNGYIGTVLTHFLKGKGYYIKGIDADYFEGFAQNGYEKSDEQCIKDIRDITVDDIKGCDFIIHLAALSNDPLGEFDPVLTEEINYKATVSLADKARKSSVGRFIYSSSQSMYGVSDTDEELEEDNSKKNPVTAYARTKWEAEQKIKALSGNGFTVACLRPSTVFGRSPKFRCDIVFNNLVACAFTTGRIVVKSDGTPWRPVVHVHDVCKAFHAMIDAPEELVSGESFNVGIANGNFTVRELAEAAAKAVPGCELVFTGEHTDSRTYKVSFNKILNKMVDYYKPEWNLENGGKELVEFFREINLTEEEFKGRRTNRLAQLKYLVDNKILDRKFHRINE